MKPIALAAILLVGFAVGCKMNLTADVYSTDLWDAANGTEGLTAPATMAFQVPSTDGCDEHAAEIARLMSGVLDDFSPKGCEQAGMESFLLADTQLPLVSSLPAWEIADSLFGILVTSEDEVVRVTMTMNVDKYDTLTDRMEDEFLQSVDLAASAVVIVLNNDDRNTIEFSAGGVFINGEPVLTISAYELQRRHKAEIRFSNVATAYMAKHGVLGEILLWKRS